MWNSESFFEIRIKRECLIKGEKVEYDACGKGDLEELKSYYSSFKYIGYSDVYFINGVKNEPGQTHHFFIKQ